MNKNVNVNEFQSNISAILKDVQDGDIYEVMRYSEPVAVVLSYKDYSKLRGNCSRCVQDLRKIAKTINPSTNSGQGEENE